MRIVRPLFVSFFSSLLFAGCSCGPTVQNRLEKISMAYCECAAPLAAVNRKASAAPPGQLNEFFQQMQTEYTRAKECTATIVGQFGRLKAAELDSVQALLGARCPELAENRDLLQEMLGE